MKVEKVKVFEPIVITLESEEEMKSMLHILATYLSLPSVETPIECMEIVRELFFTLEKLND